MKGSRLPVIGLTGTNGKTTTKELITAVLSAKYRVTSTKGNLNNDIGVPLSLLSIKEDTQIAVIEMGASHPDDIAKLVKISQPDYGLITNVGKAHLLGFGSFEGVKKAKGELYNYLGAQENSVIFLNEDDPDLKEMAGHQSCHCYGYGVRYQNASILPSSHSEPMLRMELDSEIIHTSLIGAYNATNVLAAISVGDYFGVPRKDAIRAIEAYRPTNNRSQLSRTERNTLIMDAYNANPSSMAAALENFALVEDSFKIALLGDMRELGADSLREHRACVGRIQEMLSKGSLQGAYIVGEEFGKALEGLSDSRIRHFSSSEALAEHLGTNIISGASILVKGSRGIQMEKVLGCL